MQFSNRISWKQDDCPVTCYFIPRLLRISKPIINWNFKLRKRGGSYVKQGGAANESGLVARVCSLFKAIVWLCVSQWWLFILSASYYCIGLLLFFCWICKSSVCTVVAVVNLYIYCLSPFSLSFVCILLLYYENDSMYLRSRAVGRIWKSGVEQVFSNVFSNLPPWLE